MIGLTDMFSEMGNRLRKMGPDGLFGYRRWLRFPNTVPILTTRLLDGTKTGGFEIRTRGICHGGMYAGLALAFSLLGPSSALGQEMPVSMNDQVSLFTRVVAFDRSFEARSADGLVVGVLFRSDQDSSVEAKDAFSIALTQAGFTDAQGRPPRIVTLENGPQLSGNLESQQVDLLYVTPIQGLDILSLTAYTRRLKILTLSGVPSYVANGLSVALEMDGDRHIILINIEAADAEQSTFPPGLLRMARIVPGSI